MPAPRWEVLGTSDREAWYWRLVAGNGKVVATSLGETFTRVEDAQRAARAAKRIAEEAVELLTRPEL